MVGIARFSQGNAATKVIGRRRLYSVICRPRWPAALEVEADWSVEIGEGLARIEIPWRGAGPGSGCEFVDLVSESDLPATGLSASLARIPEVRHEPVLLHALLLLNGVHSSVCTSKCDLWTIGEEEIDPYEFD